MVFIRSTVMGSICGLIGWPAVLAMAMESPAQSGVLDTLVFAQETSEQAHHLTAERSEILTGALGNRTRRLLPREPVSWEGGSLAFTLKVDPKMPTYATIRFWGGEGSPDRLFLFCEGKQIGYRHLGDVDILDVGAHEPPSNGRFYYITTPLPIGVLRGKSEAHFEIRANGPIWGYGETFARYQKDMTEPTRGLYQIVTHTDPCYVPAVTEIQGQLPATLPVRATPGAEIIDLVKERVNGELHKYLKDKRPLNQMQMIFLAKGYFAKWSEAGDNPAVAASIVTGVDELYRKFRENPSAVRADQSVYNADWFATGMAAEAVRLLSKQLAERFDQPLSAELGGLVRRQAWLAMFKDSRDWLRKHRRLYTNQSMINDMNLYRCHRAVAVLDPTAALPETQALRYLRESIGLDPWLGSERDDGSPEKPMGEQYLQLTAKGLTKELGYVGYYGEVIDWVTQIYDATRMPGQPGDPAIKAQLEKVANARALFRYPTVDDDGNRAMRIEAVIGWRDDHYPGDVTYGERPTWDATPLYAEAATLDAKGIGYAQQMFADNQFFAAVQRSLENHGLRVTTGLLGIPDQYAAVQAQKPSAYRLPMTTGQPDFIFSDEEDGVVVIKRGDEMFYASLYWRARHAINNLARIHLITPRFDRIAVVRQETQFTPSGHTYKRPNWVDFGFANGGHRYPGTWNSALEGEEMPIAKVPDGIAFKPGNENPYAGKGDFYQCRYGKYLIGMNCTHDKRFSVRLPDGVSQARNVVTGQMVGASPIPVPAMSTVVLIIE